MPLYEFIIISKAGTSQRTAEMLQHAVKSVLTSFPSVKIREVTNLGDRIMGNAINRDKISYSIGRYLQILMDAPPAVHLTLIAALKDGFRDDYFRSHMHRVNDLDYALNMYFRAGRSIDSFTDVKDYQYAQKVMEMKEKIDNYK